MAIERVCFDVSSVEANNAEIADFLGTLPSGLTMSSTNQFTATPLNGNAVTIGVNNTIYWYGFRTSHGVMITGGTQSTASYGIPSVIITESNLGSDGVIGITYVGGYPSDIHAIDLTYSETDYAWSAGHQKFARLTSFTPVVFGTRTYAPHCFWCRDAQNQHVACQMIVGGRSFAYTGRIALED